MIKYQSHGHHPVGDELKRELKAYADDLKMVSVFKPSTDTAKLPRGSSRRIRRLRVACRNWRRRSRTARAAASLPGAFP